MKLVAGFLLFIGTIGLFQGCTKEETVLAPQISGLIGTWRLVEPDSAYKVTLTFALDTDNPPLDITPFLASGSSSVNDYSLRLFATIDGTMSASTLASTKKAGTPAAMNFEQRYFNNLKAAARYKLLSTNRLYLYHGGEQPHVLVYEKVD